MTVRHRATVQHFLLLLETSKLQAIHPIYYITFKLIVPKLIILLLKISTTDWRNSMNFPWPQSLSMTFQAWKIPFLNSMTFQDVWKPWKSQSEELCVAWQRNMSDEARHWNDNVEMRIVRRTHGVKLEDKQCCKAQRQRLRTDDVITMQQCWDQMVLY